MQEHEVWWEEAAAQSELRTGGERRNIPAVGSMGRSQSTFKCSLTMIRTMTL